MLEQNVRLLRIQSGGREIEFCDKKKEELSKHEVVFLVVFLRFLLGFLIPEFIIHQAFKVGSKCLLLVNFIFLLLIMKLY